MKQRIFQLLIGIYVLTIGYSLYLNLIVAEESRSSAGAITQVPLAFIPIVGAALGLGVSKAWGGFKSKLGRAIAFYSLGTMAWGLGVVGWLFYIYVLGVTEVPYPSPADFVYMFAQIMWYAGSITVASVIGAQYGLRDRFGLLKVILGSVFGVTLSYVLLVIIARDGSISAESFNLQTFFDFYYPIATALSLTLVSVVYVLSHKYLGGIYRSSMIVLFVAFVFQFFGDFLYTYSTTNETYHNGYWPDMLFTTAMMLLTIGISRFDPKYAKIATKKAASTVVADAPPKVVG